MITITFTDNDKLALDRERYYYPHPRIQKKMEVLYLKSMDVAHNEICRLCKISRPTLAKYLHTYNLEGIDGLKRWEYSGRENHLMKYADSLEAHFTKHPPMTSNQALVEIEELTKIRRSPTQIREFMRRIGMRFRKMGFVPKGVETTSKQIEQEEFVKNKLQPILQEAKAGNRAVIFLDASHFIHSVYLGYLWCIERIFVRSASGRRRWNVLGALDAISMKVHTLCNDSYITATTVCEFLNQLRKYYGTKPITIFLDNAKYQHCEIVLQRAASLNIDLEFLPTYSPNLNLIERYWKFVKKKCLYAKYYETFTDFRQGICTCINNADSKHKKELKTLLSWNFQSFKNVNVSSV